jgi:steroid delta-isomerase-like uncharacterized protein
MPVDENKMNASLYINGMHNEKNVDISDVFTTPECIIHLGLDTLSREDYKGIVQNYINTFPDTNTTLDDVFGEDNMVAIRWTSTFTHNKPYMGFPATNKKITFTGTSVYRFSESKIVEIWINWDRLSLMQQLGLVRLGSKVA